MRVKEDMKEVNDPRYNMKANFKQASVDLDKNF